MYANMMTTRSVLVANEPKPKQRVGGTLATRQSWRCWKTLKNAGQKILIITGIMFKLKPNSASPQSRLFSQLKNQYSLI
jgi:hypothetical protein